MQRTLLATLAGALWVGATLGLVQGCSGDAGDAKDAKQEAKPAAATPGSDLVRGVVGASQPGATDHGDGRRCREAA